MKKTKKNVLQLNNQFIRQEKMKRKSESLESRRKTRFMGMILILVIFLFTLPAYNLVQSYHQLLERREKLEEMKTSYKDLSETVDEVQSLERKLADKDFAAKYVRAKYYYSKDDEFIYTIPGLLPK